jgi:mRNA guanylyltransferase
MKGMNQMFDHRIMECYRDPSTGRWRPKIEPDGTPRFRDDKTDANHISTVNSVLESIQDAVSEQDLIDNSAKIRTGYKARQQQKAEQEQRAAAEAKRKAEAARQQQQQAQQAQEQRRDEDMDDGPSYDDD